MPESEHESSPDSSRTSSPEPPEYSPINSDEEDGEHEEEEDTDETENQSTDLEDTDSRNKKRLYIVQLDAICISWLIFNIDLETSDLPISLHLDFEDEHMQVEDSANRQWRGFKMVGDNVDKLFKSSFQRIDRAKQSLHYFHAYAVLDRVDFSGLSDSPKHMMIDVNTLLPNADDLEMMKTNFEVLVSRYVKVLITFLDNHFFADMCHIYLLLC